MQGRVEICYSGVWGTVCDDLWGRADAAVACRQLGFSSSGIYTSTKKCDFPKSPLLLPQLCIIYFIGAVARSSAIFGQGTGPVFLDDLKCTGLEYRLFDCPGRAIETTPCSHSEDAGVECVAGMSPSDTLWSLIL